MGKADLHIHTRASDGSCDSEEILRLAVEKGISTISITDHDTIGGYLKARKAAENLPVTLIPGVEFTALHSGKEIHVLAYNFNPDDPGLKHLLGKQKLARLDRMEKILGFLRKNEGIDLTLDEIKGQAGSNNVGRPHIAQILVKKKIVASVAEAFIRYLGTPLIEKIDVGYRCIEEIADVVGEAGGATILAHPGPLYNPDEMQELIDAGLDGLECIHPSHSFDQQKRFTELAARQHLLVTGGSDFHGTGREYDPYFGIVTLSDKRVKDLERITENRKKLKMNIGS
ncbi:MAG: PHP domain-containing protein [Balneolaceae bacterium]